MTKKINKIKIDTVSRLEEPVSPLPDPVLSQNLSAVFPVHRFRFPGRLFVVVVVVVVPLEAAADVIKLFKGVTIEIDLYGRNLLFSVEKLTTILALMEHCIFKKY